MYFNFNNISYGYLLFLILLLKNCIAEDFFTEKPSYIETCKIFEPGFTKCSTSSIQKLMTQVAIGIPEVNKRIGPVDPMKLDKLFFKQDNNEAATISANITEFYVKGFSDIKIKESRVNKKDFSWQTKVLLPKLRMDGKYKMDGRILLLPLSGNGNIYLEIENCDLLMRTKTNLYDKDDFTFYNVTDVRVSFNMTGAKAYLDNLFNGRSKEIEKSTNEFFNENWRDFFEALRPIITETIEKVLLNILKGLFDVVPANFLISDIPSAKQLYESKNH